MTEPTLFDLPNAPEEIDIVLTPADLRRINFSALEFPTIRRALIEYIKTYFPDQFNDFIASNGIMMVLELVSYVASLLSVRSDVIADESFLPTAQSKIAVINHLALINKSFNKRSPAVVEIEITIRNPVATEIRIPAKYVLTAPGADGKQITYELFRAPGDFESYLSIPPGKRGVVGWAIEGKFAESITYTSTGGSNQSITLDGDNILLDPISFIVTTGGIEKYWRKVDIIERAQSTDEVFEVRVTDTGIILLVGDDVAGKALVSGQTVDVIYRTGGGSRGRIGSNGINRSDFISPQPPATAAVEVLFRNLNPSNGGLDDETIPQVKKRAPKEAAAIERAVSGEDYAVLTKGFAHPVYGSVLKAVATVRTSLNANIVELYILAVGPNDTPIIPSQGLRSGVENYFEAFKVLTDEVRVLSGAVKPLSLDANVVLDRNVTPAIVKVNVDRAITDFFSIDKFDMGQAFYLSNLYEIVQRIDGVKFIDIISPSDDILPTSKIASESESGVGFNEVIVLGSTNIRYFQD